MLIINPKSKPGYTNYHFVAGSLKDGLCPSFSDSRVHARGRWKCVWLCNLTNICKSLD